MLQPELKFRRDKIRSLMVSQGIDAALITGNANLHVWLCSQWLSLPPPSFACTIVFQTP